jgi:hypothetical protein
VVVLRLPATVETQDCDACRDEGELRGHALRALSRAFLAALRKQARASNFAACLAISAFALGESRVPARAGTRASASGLASQLTRC